MSGPNGPSREPRRPDRQAPFDGGDPASVEQRKVRTGELERRRLAGLKLIVESADARLWLWDLLAKCGIHRTSFTGNSETFFREGARNVGLQVQAELVRHFPESLITMMREAETPPAQTAATKEA